MDIRWLQADELDRVTAVLGVARLHQGDGDYLVAWVGDDPVGHAHLTRTSPPEVQDVEVREDRRGQGIGAGLIDAAERRASERGDRTLRLTVSATNDGARSLYERLGFRATDEPPLVVRGTIQLRTGPIEVDDVLVALEKPL